jgi:hypothetical protein
MFEAIIFLVFLCFIFFTGIRKLLVFPFGWATLFRIFQYPATGSPFYSGNFSNSTVQRAV